MNIRILIMSIAMAATAGAVWAKLPAPPRCEQHPAEHHDLRMLLAAVVIRLAG